MAVRPLQYPGRESRFREPALQSIDALAEGALAALRPHCQRADGSGLPFAFYGHSLGALLAYAIAQRQAAEGGPLPQALFVSGARAPHSALPGRPLYALPEPALLERLAEMGGTPPRVLREPALMQLFLPLLRADFTAADTYQRPASDPALPCPIIAFEGADDDQVEGAKIAAWRERTSARFEHLRLPGGHFFIHSARDALLDALGQRLLPRA